MLKIWFQAANRLSKNIEHILHKTPLKRDMKIFIKKTQMLIFVQLFMN